MYIFFRRILLTKNYQTKIKDSRVSISQISVTAPPLNLPVWIDVFSTSTPPSTYENTFWFVEPLGEYIYYLAGDFKKAPNGNLAYGSAQIEMKAEVTFEEDVIAVHRVDDWRHQEYAEQNSQYGIELSHMSFGEVLAQLPRSANADGLLNVMPFNEKYKKTSSIGMARLEFFDPDFEGMPPELRMIFQAIRREDGLPERLMELRLTCRDRSQNIGVLCSEFSQMITKFSDLPYENLEGAIRL